MNPHTDPKLLNARIRELEALVRYLADHLYRAVQVIHQRAEKTPVDTDHKPTTILP